MIHTQSHNTISLPTTVGPESRVWIYQASRKLNESETAELQKLAEKFVEDWKAHGTNLSADFGFYFNRFLCLFVDESAHGASGCSIDSSMRFVKFLEEKYAISFTDRTQVAFLDESNEVQAIPLADLAKAKNKGLISENSLVFDNLVKTKREMEFNWITPINASWHSRFLA